MQTYRIKTSIDEKGRLKIDIPTSLQRGEVEVVMVIEQKEKNHYDFSDLSGRLQWKGDAVAAQRALRDEW